MRAGPVRISQPPLDAEADDARLARLSREAALIEQARARLDAGEGVSGDELNAWLQAYEQADEAVPVPRKQGGSGTSR